MLECLVATVKHGGGSVTIWAAISWYSAGHVNLKKINDSRNRSGVAQRVPGGLDSQISMIFGT